MIRFKEIRIAPSDWYLDVLYMPDTQKGKDALGKFSHKRYGSSIDFMEKQNWGEVATVESGKASHLKGEKRIVMVLATKRLDVLIHELMHVVWQSAHMIGFEMNYDSQEWQAVLIEYLFREVQDKKGYKTIK